MPPLYGPVKDDNTLKATARSLVASVSDCAWPGLREVKTWDNPRFNWLSDVHLKATLPLLVWVVMSGASILWSRKWRFGPEIMLEAKEGPMQDSAGTKTLSLP